MYPSEDIKEFIAIDEACQISGYSKHHLRRLVNQGRIHARKLGTFWLVHKVSLYVYLQASKSRHQVDRRYGPRSSPKGGDPP